MEGKGVPQDDRLAIEWFKKAASQNYADSKYHLGYMYLNGRGTATNAVEGTKWLAKAAQQDHGPAQFSLGTAYVSGTGVTQDYVQAHKWISPRFIKRESGLACSSGVASQNDARTDQGGRAPGH
jgi:TPR repeat protein